MSGEWAMSSEKSSSGKNGSDTNQSQLDKSSNKGEVATSDPVKGFDWKRVLGLTTGAGDSFPRDLLPQRESERQEILLALADINHRLYGHGKCNVCRAPVRAIMRTVGVDDAGQTWEYECLCRRCLEAEKAHCRKVTSYIAGVVFDEYENRRELVQRVRPAGNVAA
jgi:hypothetical protein